MAKSRQADSSSEQETVSYSVDLQLAREQAIRIAALNPGEDAEGRRIAALALGLAVQLSEGGIMLPPQTVARMQQDFSGRITAEHILDRFQVGAGRKDGQLSVTVSVDPAYENTIKQAADFNGVTVPQMIQNIWDMAWANGWFFDPQPTPQNVLMTPGMKDELVELFGKDFSNGSELAELVKEFVSVPAL